MRIIVISDTHRKLDALYTIFERNENADFFIFLGDGERELDDIKLVYPYFKVLSVAGNCDFASMAPVVGEVHAMGKKIVYLHGHTHNVKYHPQGLSELARGAGADIVLFGHTHERYYKYADGVHYLNPGSAGNPRDGKPASYAFIDITDAGIVCNHVNVH